MTPEVGQAFRAIKEDQEHGAAFLAGQVLDLLALAAASNETYEYPRFMKDMEALVKAIAVARPSMTPLAVAAERWLRDLRRLSVKLSTARGMGEAGVTLSRRLKEGLENSRHEAAQWAGRLVGGYRRVITCSCSATVAEALGRAGPFTTADKGDFSVYVCHSGGHGERLAAFLNEQGLSAVVFPDSEVGERAQTADLALVGADSVLPDGSVINGIPTLALARAASAARLPLYVVADTFKWASGEVPLEEGFELIPAGLVTAIITEKGPVRPGPG